MPSIGKNFIGLLAPADQPEDGRDNIGDPTFPKRHRRDPITAGAAICVGLTREFLRQFEAYLPAEFAHPPFEYRTLLHLGAIHSVVIEVRNVRSTADQVNVATRIFRDPVVDLSGMQSG